MRISDWSSDVCSSDLPFLYRRAAPDLQTQFRDRQRARAGEWLFAVFAVLAAYQCLMLVVAGRYRDFPPDYFLLPVCGFAVLGLLGVRSDERRVGNEWVSTARSPWSPDLSKTKQ